MRPSADLKSRGRTLEQPHTRWGQSVRVPSHRIKVDTCGGTRGPAGAAGLRELAWIPGRSSTSSGTRPNLSSRFRAIPFEARCKLRTARRRWLSDHGPTNRDLSQDCLVLRPTCCRPSDQADHPQPALLSSHHVRSPIEGGENRGESPVPTLSYVMRPETLPMTWSFS